MWILNRALIILISLLVYSCTDVTRSTEQRKNYGIVPTGLSNSIVELFMADFSEVKTLHQRINEVMCQDSLVRLNLEDSDVLRRVILLSICDNDIGCVSARNVVYIFNDTIKQMGVMLPMDSIKRVVEREYVLSKRESRDKYSQSPKKLIFMISYERKQMKALKSALVKLLNEYDSLNLNEPILIRICNKEVAFPPPPPKPFQEKGESNDINYDTL